MNRIKAIYFLSILVLISAGVIFVRANRYGETARVTGNLKDKTIVFYSSNYKRQYINSSGGEMGDLEKLSVEGSDNLKRSALNAKYFKIAEGELDPYSQAAVYLDTNLKKDAEYILIDISRGMTKYGRRCNAGEKVCCPISIVLSKKSKSYSDSLLFAGRIKAVLDKKYNDLQVRIVESGDGDFNQGRGYIGMLVEVGDASNSFNEAENSLKIFCEAVEEVIVVPY